MDIRDAADAHHEGDVVGGCQRRRGQRPTGQRHLDRPTLMGELDGRDALHRGRRQHHLPDRQREPGRRRVLLAAHHLDHRGPPGGAHQPEARPGGQCAGQAEAALPLGRPGRQLRQQPSLDRDQPASLDRRPHGDQLVLDVDQVEVGGRGPLRGRRCHGVRGCGAEQVVRDGGRRHGRRGAVPGQAAGRRGERGRGRGDGQHHPGRPRPAARTGWSEGSGGTGGSGGSGESGSRHARGGLRLLTVLVQGQADDEPRAPAGSVLAPHVTVDGEDGLLHEAEAQTGARP